MNIDLKQLISPPYYKLIDIVLTNKGDYTHYYLKGGRGSYKSSTVALLIPIIIMLNKDINALVLRKISATLKDSVYNKILWAIDTLKINQFFKPKKSPLEITYIPTNQTIFFRGADDPFKIKSINPKQGYIGITFFEEYDQFGGASEIRNILQSTNRGGNKFYNFYVFNPPKSINNWANVDVEEDKENKLVVHSTYLDVNPRFLGDLFFREAEHLKKKNYRDYKHEYLGIPTGVGGAVFENIESRTITDDEIKRFDRFYYGIDFGFTISPFAFIKLYYNSKSNVLYVLDEIYKTNLKNSVAVDMIQKIIGEDRKNIVADSEEPRSIADLRERGLNIAPAKKGKGSINHGFKFLQDLEKIVIDKKRTPNAYKEFTCYEYATDRNGAFIPDYPDKDDHILSAVRYALEEVSTRKVAKWY